MSAGYSTRKSTSNIFVKWKRILCVWKIWSFLVISTYKSVDRKTYLDKVLAQMKSQHNWRSYHITAWKFSMTKYLQFYGEKILSTVFISIDIFKFLVGVEDIKKSLVQNIEWNLKAQIGTVWLQYWNIKVWLKSCYLCRLNWRLCVYIQFLLFKGITLLLLKKCIITIHSYSHFYTIFPPSFVYCHPFWETCFRLCEGWSRELCYWLMCKALQI